MLFGILTSYIPTQNPASEKEEKICHWFIVLFGICYYPLVSPHILFLSGVGLNLDLVFGRLAERGPIAHAQSVDVTDIKAELSPSAFRAYGESSPKKLKSRLGELTFTKGGFATKKTASKVSNFVDISRAVELFINGTPTPRSW